MRGRFRRGLIIEKTSPHAEIPIRFAGLGLKGEVMIVTVKVSIPIWIARVAAAWRLSRRVARASTDCRRLLPRDDTCENAAAHWQRMHRVNVGNDGA